MLYDSRSYNPIKGQGHCHGGPKVAKMANFKVCFLCFYACNEMTTGNGLL